MFINIRVHINKNYINNLSNVYWFCLVALETVRLDDFPRSIKDVSKMIDCL